MIRSNPKGLRKVLKWMNDRYGNGTAMVVGANGLPGKQTEPKNGSERLNDFKQLYINEALKGWFDMYMYTNILESI